MYKHVLLWALIFLAALGGLQVALKYTDAPLYTWMDAYLEQRKDLWFRPAAEGGSRATDLSDDVCPLVSAEKLDEIVGKHPFFMTDFGPSKVAGQPDNAHIWRVTRTIGFLQNQSFSITLAPDDYCRVSYRHVK